MDTTHHTTIVCVRCELELDETAWRACEALAREAEFPPEMIIEHSTEWFLRLHGKRGGAAALNMILASDDEPLIPLDQTVQTIDLIKNESAA